MFLLFIVISFFAFSSPTAGNAVVAEGALCVFISDVVPQYTQLRFVFTPDVFFRLEMINVFKTFKKTLIFNILFLHLTTLSLVDNLN